MMPLLSIVGCLPFAGVLALLAVDGRREAVMRRMATTASALAFAASIPLWFWYEPRGAEWQFAEHIDGVRRIGASYSIGLDGLSLTFVLLTTMVGFLAACASWRTVTARVRQHYIAILLLEGSVLGVFMALDFLLLFLFWQIAVGAAVYLVRMSGARVRALAILAGCGLAASAAMLAGILTLYFQYHSLASVYTFDIRPFQHLALPGTLQAWTFAAFFLTFAFTASLLPVQVWASDNSGASTPASALIGALVLKMGVYGFLRVSLPILPDASRQFGPVLAAICLLTIIVSAAAVFVQRDPKRAIACAATSYVGFSLLGVFAATPGALTGAIVHQLAQGLSVAALLLLAGFAYERGAAVQPWKAPVGMLRAMPAFAGACVAAILSFVGAPALAGFVGAKMVVGATWAVHPLAAAVALTGFLLTAGGLVWRFARTTAGPAGVTPMAPPHDLGMREIAMMLPLLAAGIWIGVHPAPLLSRLETHVARVVMRVSPEYAAQVADCLRPNAAPPPVSDPGLPAGMVMAAPCADGSKPAAPPSPAR
jgi:NADH-quinone oxidoreductase subunit M